MPSTVMVLPGERVCELMRNSEAWFAVKVELAKVIITAGVGVESGAEGRDVGYGVERKGIGVEETMADSAPRVLADSGAPGFVGLFSGAEVWSAV